MIIIKQKNIVCNEKNICFITLIPFIFGVKLYGYKKKKAF